MEYAVNLMAKHFRRVVVDASYWTKNSIRFRPDLVTTRCYFSRVPSQINLWQNNGGVLIRWQRKPVGPHEAMLYAECPRSTALLDRYAREASSICVVYEPPAWRMHFETAATRYSKKPVKRLVVTEGLERMKQLLESSERFTPASLDRLLHAHPVGQSLPSSAPVSPAVAERSSGTGPGAP